MRIRIYSLLLVLFCVQTAHSQSSVQLQIRESFEKAEVKTKPATANFIFPKDIENSFNVSGALGLKIPITSDRRYLFVSGQWNKNSLIDKEQNNYNLGLDFQVSTSARKLIQNTFSFSAKYNNDVIKKAEGGKLKILWTPLLSNISSLTIPAWIIPATGAASIDIGKSNLLSVSHNIDLGIEYQHNTKSVADSLNGGIGRIYYSYNLSIFPLPSESLFDKTLYLNFSFAQRQEFMNKTLTKFSKRSNLIQTSLNYILAKNDDEEKATVTLAWVNGENPWVGLEKQTYWILV
jgi:hypothetical protein